MFPDTAISGEAPQVVSLFVGVYLYGSFARGEVHEFICHIIRVFSLEFSIVPHATQPKIPVKSLIFLNFYRRAFGERRGIRKHGEY